MAVLQYSAKSIGNVTVIALGGSIDAETAPEFAKKIKSKIADGSKKILCNLAKVTFMASAGFGVLLEVSAMLEKEKGELRISSMTPKEQKVCKAMGFLNVFKIYDNDEKALESF